MILSILNKYKTFFIVFFIWGCITLLRIFNHIPWCDEAHAWTIAEELNIIDIFKLMHQEGHLFIWYLCLLLFAKFNVLYPYSMQIINWIFCASALIILWLKSPFNNWIKSFITFSFPFLFTYSVIARCYSIGILFLFLLTIHFKDKVKRPLLYSVLLIITANTSVMALFGATAFGVLFLYDFIKSKPEKTLILKTSIILLLGAVTVLLQIGGAGQEGGYHLSTNFLNNWLFYAGFAFLACFLFLIRSQLRIVFFVISTTSLLAYCFMFVYQGHFIHHFFYYIYFIIASWLYFDLSDNNNKSKLLTCFVAIISCFLCFYPLFMQKEDRTKFLEILYLQNMSGISETEVIKTLLNDNNFKGNNVIVADSNMSFIFSMLPYQKTMHKKLVSYCNGNYFDHTFYITYLTDASNKYCKINQESKHKKYFTVNFSYEHLGELIEKYGDSLAYGLPDIKNLTGGIDLDEVYFQLSGQMYSIKKYKCFTNGLSCIYLVGKPTN